MTLVGKIKDALHSNKSGTDTGTAQDQVQTTGKASEPTTGPDAYQPLSHSAGTGDTTGAGSQRSAGGTTAGSAGTGVNQKGLSGAESAGAGKISTSSGNNPDTTFQQGYKEDEPGFSSKYKSPEPLYKESVQQGGDRYSADLSASAKNEHWAQARELTLAAEREVAAAELSGQKANKELAAAQKAEEAVRKAQLKHREALEEAEKHRAIAADPNLKEQDLLDAQNMYEARRRAAEQAERDARDAESDLAGKRRDLEQLHQQEDKFGQRLPGLQDDFAARQRDRAAAEEERQKLLAAAKDTEANRSGIARELDGLDAELGNLERTAAAKQQEYIEARNAAQNAAARIDELKARIRSLDDELLGAKNRAQEADEHLPAYREAELRAQRQLENANGEWQRLKALEDEYGRNYTLANDRYQKAHSLSDPASRELQDSHSVVQARQDDLERARSRAALAERKYRELLALADRHKKYGDSAAQAAEAHGEKYEALNKEAHIHASKHAEYWAAARNQGETGSTQASETIQKLEDKVKQLMHREA